MHKFTYIILFIVVQYSGNLHAQEKFEKESRIKQKNVPSEALLFIDSLNFKNKIKWYKEEGFNRQSIEAKFKYNKARYSVEFDTLGNMEDIEIEVDWDDLESDIRDSISLQLKKDCLKHKIVKVQKQYKGSESELFLLLKADKKSQSLIIKYELIVRCRQQKKVDLYEYLFENKGVLISISKIIFRNSSHLEY